MLNIENAAFYNFITNGKVHEGRYMMLTEGGHVVVASQMKILRGVEPGAFSFMYRPDDLVSVEVTIGSFVTTVTLSFLEMWENYKRYEFMKLCQMQKEMEEFDNKNLRK